ncbi:hypothetical protein VNO77_27366 [Canavalia gladiata]|uniref:Uncharacterized protein n=1 Tax=Canavalia gladiata TaxID=3824 RepID=A0AAN9Q713_CANGL
MDYISHMYRTYNIQENSRFAGMQTIIVSFLSDCKRNQAHHKLMLKSACAGDMDYTSRRSVEHKHRCWMVRNSDRDFQHPASHRMEPKLHWYHSIAGLQAIQSVPLKRKPISFHLEICKPDCNSFPVDAIDLSISCTESGISVPNPRNTCIEISNSCVIHILATWEIPNHEMELMWQYEVGVNCYTTRIIKQLASISNPIHQHMHKLELACQMWSWLKTVTEHGIEDPANLLRNTSNEGKYKDIIKLSIQQNARNSR